MLLNFPSHEGKCSKSDRKVSHFLRNHQTLCVFLSLFCVSILRFRSNPMLSQQARRARSAACLAEGDYICFQVADATGWTKFAHPALTNSNPPFPRTI